MKKLLRLIVLLFLPIMISFTFMIMLSGIIAGITPATFSDCTTSAVFWIVWLFLTVGMYIYVDDIMVKN
jgi:hypothetical protein